MKDNLQSAALKLQQGYAESEGLPQAAIDPTVIMGWGQIIFDLLSKCQERKAQGMIKAAKRPRLLERIVVNNAVERHTNEPRHVVKAKAAIVLKMAANADPQELQDLIDEVRGERS